MSKTMKKLGALAVLVIVGAAAAPKASDTFHFALQRSVPAADATVPSPAEIQLWFTQVPQEASLSARLVGTGGHLVETGEPTAHQDDAKAFSIRIGHPLAAGRYTVSWRGIGDDGHVVQSEFGFTVSSALTTF